MKYAVFAHRQLFALIFIAARGNRVAAFPVYIRDTGECVTLFWRAPLKEGVWRRTTKIAE